MNRFKDKVVVVSGGNSGIGLETVKGFLNEGAKVVFSGRRQEALDEVSAGLTGEFKAVLADQGVPADNKRLIDETVAAYGKIDVLFVNAGVAYFVPAEQIDDDHFDTQFNINIKGPAFLTKHAIPHINDGGAIVYNTSIVHLKGYEASSVYSATKGALRAYARVLAAELSPRKIRVNSVAPGPIETPIYGKLGMPQDAVEEMGKGFAASNPLKRFGSPKEIADAVLFLASEEASYVNGIELAIDGGVSQV